MLLGCIGDDFTGASDIANTLAKGGMSVTQYNGIPDCPAAASVEVGVVALKSRTIPVDQAVDLSLKAAEWLLAQNCEQIFFKYCSTFDSTKEGNIGPVADALSTRIGEETVLFCPAFPATGRSVYQGNLFVHDMPLSESGMKDHPLTPMTDSDLRRWLGHQTQRTVRHLPYPIVRDGEIAIREALQRKGAGYYIADAVDDNNLIELGKAVAERKFLTGGSGLSLGLPDNFRRQGKIGSERPHWQGIKGPGVVLSGSCSEATRKQVRLYAQTFPALEVTAEAIFNEEASTDGICDWALHQTHPPLIFTSADPKVVHQAQDRFGVAKTAEAIETFFGNLAVALVGKGVVRIVTAGGETSGAVVTALNVSQVSIGPEIAPGVPALNAPETGLVMALKSGNFGSETFFEEALAVLER